MRRWWMAVLAVGIGAACTGEGRDTQAAGQPAVAEQPATGAVTARQQVLYVDVRTPEEFAAGHVEGAVNIPHTEMQRRLRELEPYRNEPIVLYCRSGRRAGIALEILKDAGFENVENAGGLSDLQRQGVPTTR